MHPIVRQAYLREMEELQKEANILRAGVGLATTGARAAGSALGKVVAFPFKQVNRLAGTEAHLARHGYKPVGNTWERSARGLSAELEGVKSLKTLNPVQMAQGVGQRMWLGVKATRDMVARPGSTMRHGWNASGVVRRNADGVLVQEGAGVGIKGIGAGFGVHGLYGAMKPGKDPYDPDAGRAERIGKAVGQGVGFIGGGTGGMIAAMTASKLLGDLGGLAGKGVDAVAGGAASLVRAKRKEVQEQGPTVKEDISDPQRVNTRRQGLSGV